MATNSLLKNSNTNLNRLRLFMMMGIMVSLALLPSLVLALPATAGDDTACGTVSGFATSVQGLLNGISIIVVTIAIIFSGYQIAFAHKRMGDVAPVLIGAVLIGAASQIAKMFLGGSATAGGCAYVVNLLHTYA